MIVLLSLLAAAAPVQAKPAHPAAAKPVAKSAAAKAAPAKPAPTATVVKLSPAGDAIFRKYVGQPDEDFAALAVQLREVGQKVQLLGNAPEFDMAALEQLLRKQEELQAAMRKRSDDRLLAMLGEMTPEDRLIFSRAQISVERSRPVAAH